MVTVEVLIAVIAHLRAVLLLLDQVIAEVVVRQVAVLIVAIQQDQVAIMEIAHQVQVDRHILHNLLHLHRAQAHLHQDRLIADKIELYLANNN